MIRSRRLAPSALALFAALGCQGQAPPSPPAPAPPTPAPAPAPPDTAPATSAASPEPPAPPALPAELPSDLDLARLEPLETCAKRACALAGPFPPSAKPAAPSPVALWRQRLEGRDAKLTTPALRGGSLYGIVLGGRATLRAGRATPSALEPWDTFYAERGGVTIGCDGDDATLLLVHVTRPAAASSPPSAAGAPFDVVRLREQGDLVWARGAFRARLAFEGPGRPASFGLLRGAPTAPVAAHRHEGSWEILIALRAEGSFRLDEAAPNAGQPRPLDDGRHVAIPPGAQHAWAPAGTRPLIGVQLYVPPGPEQRFRKLAADEAAQGAAPPPAPTK